jgi:hypothetical protein
MSSLDPPSPSPSGWVVIVYSYDPNAGPIKWFENLYLLNDGAVFASEEGADEAARRCSVEFLMSSARKKVIGPIHWSWSDLSFLNELHEDSRDAGLPHLILSVQPVSLK